MYLSAYVVKFPVEERYWDSQINLLSVNVRSCQVL